MVYQIIHKLWDIDLIKHDLLKTLILNISKSAVSNSLNFYLVMVDC